MPLRAKKPEYQPNRFKALIYGSTGSGKSHFCCSFPNAYYIDTEGVLKYPHYVKMLQDNNSDAVEIMDLEEIIKEVKELMSAKHNYKSLILDSASMPCNWLSTLEIERLVNESKNKGKPIEGTEFGANKAKAARLLNHLIMLLIRIDMNVIITSHEKTKFVDDKEAGKTPDINEKMAYALGTAIHFRPTTKNSRVAYFDKSRYPELPNKECIQFDDGFKVLKEKFGDDMFYREVVPEKFATKEQLDTLNHLIKVLNVPEESYQKWLTTCKCASFDEMTETQIDTYINACNKKLTQQGE